MFLAQILIAAFFLLDSPFSRFTAFGVLTALMLMGFGFHLGGIPWLSGSGWRKYDRLVWFG